MKHAIADNETKAYTECDRGVETTQDGLGRGSVQDAGDNAREEIINFTMNFDRRKLSSQNSPPMLRDVTPKIRRVRGDHLHEQRSDLNALKYDATCTCAMFQTACMPCVHVTAMLPNLNMYSAQNVAIRLAIGVQQVLLAAFLMTTGRVVIKNCSKILKIKWHSIRSNHSGRDVDDHDGDCNAQDNVTTARLAEM